MFYPYLYSVIAAIDADTMLDLVSNHHQQATSGVQFGRTGADTGGSLLHYRVILQKQPREGTLIGLTTLAAVMKNMYHDLRKSVRLQCVH